MNSLGYFWLLFVLLRKRIKIMSTIRLNEMLLSGKPEEFKSLLQRFGKVIVVVDQLENDYSRSCSIDDKLIAEPGRPQISAAKRYIIGIGDRLIYSQVMQKRDKSKIYVLGIGEVTINDIIIWCNARRMR